MNLRSFLQQLEKEGKLTQIKKEVSIKKEIANIIYSLDEQPVIFDNVKGYDFPIFAGITSNRDIIAEGLGTTKNKLLFKLVEALRNPVKPEIVNKAPCQEVIIKNPECSICSKNIFDCEHITGEVYNGKLAFVIARDIEPLGSSLVDKPEDPKCFVEYTKLDIIKAVCVNGHWLEKKNHK